MQTSENRIEAGKMPDEVLLLETGLPVEFIELQMALDIILETHPVFSDAVKAAILPLDGEFLFDLPHTEKANGRGHIAAIRIAYGGQKAQRLAFAFLADDGMETSIREAGDGAEHLRSFAESFVNVLEKFGAH
jgi:hypothetical protein